MGTTATAQHSLAISPGAFQKCAPNLATNIRECGSVTVCNAIPMTLGNLTTSYTSSGDYLVMKSLLQHDIEIAMCEAEQNGLYDFLMSNKVNLSKKVNTQKKNSGLLQIAPFILGRQYSQINNAYWAVSNGQSAAGGNWQVSVQSTTNIPPDTRSFPPGERVYIDGQTNAGTNTHTAFIILSSTLVGYGLVLVLQPQNAGSQLPSAALTLPVTGVLKRSTANVNRYEKFCAEPPAYLNWKDVPFWVEEQRTSMCNSELYDKWRALLLADNPLYKEYGDLDEIEKNRQLAKDWQRKMVENMFWGKAINANQTLNNYTSLPQIETYMSGILDTGEGARCVGYRANMVGIYEQHAQCGRVVDLQGAALDLSGVFNALYQMMRVREGQGRKKVDQFDIFTDSITAEAINSAMIAYYNSKSQNTLRMTLDVNQDVKKAEFGFNYRSYNIFYPTVRINIISHYFFDDYLSAMQSIGLTNAGRLLWVLDFSGIYPGIIDSQRKVLKTGDLQTLAAIDESYACVMDVYTHTQTLTSVTATIVVECPMGNLLLENFPVSGIVSTSSPPTYPATTTTTTTTSTAQELFYNTQQSYTANCPAGYTGASVTVTIAANEYVSGVSQADANQKALSAATYQAEQQLVCTPIQQ